MFFYLFIFFMSDQSGDILYSIKRCLLPGVVCCCCFFFASPCASSYVSVALLQLTGLLLSEEDKSSSNWRCKLDSECHRKHFSANSLSSAHYLPMDMLTFQLLFIHLSFVHISTGNIAYHILFICLLPFTYPLR